MISLFALALVCQAGRWAQGDEPTPRTRGLESDLQAILRDAGDASIGIAYYNLKTGEQLLIHADDRFHAASTMKVPVMMEIFRQAEAGSLRLDEPIRIKNEFRSIADGSPFRLDPADDSETMLYQHLGEERSIRQLVELMITVSSNLATNLLIERVGAAKTTDFMRTLGTEDVHVRRGVEDSKAYAQGMNNEVTAGGLMTILRRLAERKVVSAEASQQMLAILRRQQFNEGIPAGLPQGTIVAHKTGSFPTVYHDAAIVEPRDRPPYVLVVLTRGIKQDPDAHKLVVRISRAIYEHVMTR